MREESEELIYVNVRMQIVNQNNQQTRVTDTRLPYRRSERKLILNNFLNDTCHRQIDINGAQIFHTDIVNRVNVFLGIYPFMDEISLAADSVINGCLMLSYKSAPSDRAQDDDTKTVFSAAGPKNRKMKEKTIGEVVEAVKKWRQLYDTSDNSGRRVYTLEGAAQQIGISKKTLDDYFSNIRTAHEFRFNFDRFRDEKMGILRKYVKIGKKYGIEGLQNDMPEYILMDETDNFWEYFQL